MTTTRTRLGRCLVVQIGATAAAAAVTGLLLTDAAGALGGAGGEVDVAVVALCEVVLACCAAWAWLATTAVVAEVLGSLRRGAPAPRRSRLAPAAWRRAVLLACGVAIAVGTAGAAQATPGAVHLDPHGRHAGAELAGLPMPDRPAGRVHAPRADHPARRTPPAAPRPVLEPAAPTAPVAATAPAAPDQVTVRPGDSLWSIATRTLAAGADDPAVAERWQAIYAANRDVLGADPDLIEPGQRLTLPDA